jgi:DNA-binding transcriptional LysR family regulator
LLANSGDALLALALKGTGLILVPAYLVEDDLKSGRLVRLLPDYATQETPVYAVYPHSRLLSAKTRTFIDFLASRFSNKPRLEAVSPRTDTHQAQPLPLIRAAV